MNSTTPVLTFVLGAQEYALLIEDVVEVAAMVEPVMLPDKRPELIGVVNRHGKVLPLIDLRHVFQQTAEPIDIATLFIVAQRGEAYIGLLVDEVYQVEYIDSSQLQSTPTTSDLIHGIISSGERLVQLIALSPLLATYHPTLRDGRTG